ncbi:hypothetical protein C491_11773 [Natronococcus amylolyticus DSM 10524]|uniref:Uncharacterized protein n=1 Tax=Natronococcus amylolyticus DSM 10524 TaxID=1227497 RepID=L9X968_9EURY|nr:hypothetical protein [Natronococcus amylolyticus]ELY57178.1 hypothetical protein C491_11773 [Natronococcus amylolyticus DSM 10524]
MSTHPHYARPEPTPDQPTTETPSTRSTAEPSSSAASDRAPATFSRTHTDRLQNLIDEWNTAFAADGSSAE